MRLSAPTRVIVLRHRGFSMVELMFALAIYFVLAGMLLHRARLVPRAVATVAQRAESIERMPLALAQPEAPAAPSVAAAAPEASAEEPDGDSEFVTWLEPVPALAWYTPVAEPPAPPPAPTDGWQGPGGSWLGPL